MNFNNTFLCAVLLSAVIVARAGIMNPIPGDPVTIDAGRVSGTLLDSGARAYFGIPFAAPPVRELRWHAPMPVNTWKGILNADTQRTGCIVAGALPSPTSGALMSWRMMYCASAMKTSAVASVSTGICSRQADMLK